jgi:hypothetical protein
LIDRRELSNILDVRFFTAADCDTDHCPVVAKGREILAVSKHEAQKFDVERCNFSKISDMAFRKQYQIKIS